MCSGDMIRGELVFYVDFREALPPIICVWYWYQESTFDVIT